MQEKISSLTTESYIFVFFLAFLSHSAARNQVDESKFAYILCLHPSNLLDLDAFQPLSSKVYKTPDFHYKSQAFPNTTTTVSSANKPVIPQWKTAAFMTIRAGKAAYVVASSLVHLSGVTQPNEEPRLPRADVACTRG